MSTVARRLGLIITGMLAVGAIGGGLAWACSPQAHIASLTPAAGPPRSEVTVRGTDFLNQTVEVRLDALDGPVLETGPGPSPVIKITIPESTSPGLHFIYAVTRDVRGNIVGQASEPFEVLGEPSPAASQTGGDQSSDSSTVDGAGAPAGGGESGSSQSGDTPQSDGAPAAATGARRVASRTAATPSRRSTDGAARGSRPSSRPTSREEGSTPKVRTGARVPSAPTHTVRTASGQRVFSGSTAPSARPTASSARGTEARPSRGSDAAAARPAQPRGASLLPTVTDPEMSEAKPGGTLAFGAGLLGLGLVAMCAGFTVVEVRRRKAMSTSGTDTTSHRLQR